MPKPLNNSSDDSDDDEPNMALLREAASGQFINDSMFKEVGQTKKSDNSLNKQSNLKSQRVLETDETVEKYDLNISETMQNFVYNKLKKILESNIEFVDVSPETKSKTKKTKTEKTINGLRLFKGADPITSCMPAETLIDDVPSKPMKPFMPKRRQIEVDNDMNDVEKLKAAAISIDVIQSQVKTWTKEPKKRKLFEYKNKKGKNELIEPANEFSQLRRKNNWNESKIARK